ncbi:MAG: glycosyltransferase family 39 protein, partial [Acidithiobacillales bacterium]
AVTEDGRFLVADGARDRILELDETGAISWSWRGKEDGLRPRRVVPLPSGDVLVAGDGGVAEIRRDESIAWRAPLPIPGMVAGFGQSPDGSVLLVLDNQVWRLGPDGTARRLTFDGPAPLFLHAAPRPSGGLVLWDHSWRLAYEVEARGDRLVAIREFPVTLPTTFSLDPSGVPVYISDAYTVSHLRGGTGVTFRVPFEPRAVGYLPTAGHYLLAYQRTPDLTWPDTRPRPSEVSVFRRPRLFAWLLGALIVGALFHAVKWKRLPRTAPAAFAPPPPVPPPTSRPALRASALALFAAGLSLATLGQLRLTRGAEAGWLPLYLCGAALAAAAVVAGRRLAPTSKDPFWSRLARARPDLSGWPLLLASGVLVVAGTVWLFLLSARHADPVDVTGLFLALNLFLALTALLFASRPPLVPALLLPLGVAAVTFLYRLAEVPANTHFDFNWYVWPAWKLLTGVLTNPWEHGFVPVPVIGLIPEMLGLALAGESGLGFRLGSALFGMTAPLAVYLLGRAYRDRRTGLLAAIFLAGSLPFIHFTRVPSAGEAATASLWTLAVFALALRSNNPGWWIATGSAAGFTLYLWPAARVAPLACFVAGLLLAARSPRQAARRWFGPLLAALALAVWIAPVLPLWIQNAGFAFPRAESSIEVYRFGEGIRAERLRSSFGVPLRNALGGFFVLYDNSTQGSLSPACNDAEAVLLATGLVIVLVEGLSANVLLLAQFGLTLLFLGAFATSPPWYTRLLPAVPVAAILMARTVVAGLDLLPAVSRTARQAVFAVAAAAVLFLSPVSNFRRYLRYETEERPLWESTAIADSLRALPKDVRLYVLLAWRPDWSLHAPLLPPRLGEIMPLIWDLRLTEIHDLTTALPLPPGPKAIVIPRDDFGEGVRAVTRLFPEARLEPVRGRRGEPLASLLLIDK